MANEKTELEQPAIERAVDSNTAASAVVSVVKRAVLDPHLRERFQRVMGAGAAQDSFDFDGVVMRAFQETVLDGKFRLRFQRGEHFAAEVDKGEISEALSEVAVDPAFRERLRRAMPKMSSKDAKIVQAFLQESESDPEYRLLLKNELLAFAEALDTFRQMLKDLALQKKQEPSTGEVIMSVVRESLQERSAADDKKAEAEFYANADAYFQKLENSLNAMANGAGGNFAASIDLMEGKAQIEHALEHLPPEVRKRLSREFEARIARIEAVPLAMRTAKTLSPTELPAKDKGSDGKKEG